MEGQITITLDASFAKIILDGLNSVREGRRDCLNVEANYMLAGVIDGALASGLDDGSVVWVD